MRNDPLRLTRNMLTLLAVGLLVSGLGAFYLERSDTTVELVTQNPQLVAAVPETTTTTAAPTTTAPPTTAAAAARSGTGRRPVTVPREPYAPEPIRQIGSIEIPKIGLTHTVWEGVTLRNIDNGPSHWPGTAMPGEAGNAVFAGHRVTHSKPFRNIDKLVEGDEVIFTIGDRRSVYRVVGHEIVTPKELRIVNQTAEPTATLFACHPPGSAKYRYVVHLVLAG